MIAKTLLELETFQINYDQPFKWASGKLMPYYCDNRLLLSYPEARDLIIKNFITKATDLHEPADAIVGVATAGIPWGAILAEKLKLPFSYVRSKAKEHGLKKLVEGNLKAGQRVIVVEDLISTGKSSIEACQVLEAEGIHVIKVLSIFSYELEEAKLAFQKANLEYESLTNLDAILVEYKRPCLTMNL